MNWEIDTHKNVCQSCSREFGEGDSVISNIIDNEGVFIRSDYCDECWNSNTPSESFYFWKSVYAPKKKKKVFVDDEVLMDFFSRLEEEDSEGKQNFRYLLSLILMRKKLLEFADVCKEGNTEYLILRNKNEREFRVLNPHLKKEALEEVKNQMMDIMHQDFFTEGN
jgi:hypothetical protein